MATNNMSIQRIKREFKEVLKSEEITQCSIKLDIINDNFTELRGEIAGRKFFNNILKYTDFPYL